MFQSKENRKIATADKPLRLGGRVEYLSLDDFERNLGITFLEKVEVNEYPQLRGQVFPESVSGMLSSSELKAQLRILIDNPRQDLVICKINDSVGHGVFALSDIPKDTVLCFYSGTLIPYQMIRSDDHGIKYHGADAVFSTKDYRGIASFIQHMPMALPHPDVKQLSLLYKSHGQSVSEQDLKLDNELYSIEFCDQRAKDQVMTANVRQEFITFNGTPTLLLVTRQSIKAGDQLGFGYGSIYWLSRGYIPELFDKNGDILSKTFYKRTFWQLDFGKFHYVGYLPSLVSQLKQGKMRVNIVNDHHVQKTIEAPVLANELLRVNAITEVEHLELGEGFRGELPTTNGFFDHPELSRLVKKYKLPDTTQTSLEKGLRNAAYNNLIEDLKVFIAFVKNVNAADSNLATTRTALHCAAFKGHSDCYELLIAAGANALQVDATGQTAEVLFHCSLGTCAK